MEENETNLRRTRRARRRSGDYYEDRSEYYRERDRYFAERDKYYQERDKYYNDMDEYSRIASSAADSAYEDGHRSERARRGSDGYIDDYSDDYIDDYDILEDEPEEYTRQRRNSSSSAKRTDRDRYDRDNFENVKSNYASERNQSGRDNNRKTRDRADSTENAGYSERRGTSNRNEESRNSTNTNSANHNTRVRNAGNSVNSGKSVNGGNPANARKSGKKKKHPILIVILLLVIAFLGFAGYKFMTRQSGYYTVAVFGVDSRNGNVGKNALSDVNIIARVDMATGEIKLVSIYRDTYTQIDKDGNYHKFNEAYFRGGAEQALWALENNTDVKIDDYVTFNWKAVVDAINILGGVDIDISDAEFKYINAYITETVNSTGVGSVQLEHAGANHLDGVQAVAYARLRKMDDDYTRTERQRKVISLLMDKAKSADFSVLYNVLVTVLPQTLTSVGITDLLPFAQNISKYYIGETAGFPFDKVGKNIGKLDAVIPVTWESNDIALHQFLYPDQTYSPSSLVQQISAHVAEVSGLGGSGETSVKTDDLVTGNAGSTDTTKHAETAAETESITETESESETEETTIEEILDPELDNDSDNEEDMVPDGSNTNIGNNGRNSETHESSSTKETTTAAETKQQTYETASSNVNGSGVDGPGGPGTGPNSGSGSSGNNSSSIGPGSGSTSSGSSGSNTTSGSSGSGSSAGPGSGSSGNGTENTGEGGSATAEGPGA